MVPVTGSTTIDQQGTRKATRIRPNRSEYVEDSSGWEPRRTTSTRTRVAERASHWPAHGGGVDLDTRRRRRQRRETSLRKRVMRMAVITGWVGPRPRSKCADAWLGMQEARTDHVLTWAICATDQDRGEGCSPPGQRLARARLGVENAYDRQYEPCPSRLGVPARGAGDRLTRTDLEHLDYACDPDLWLARDLPRAVGSSAWDWCWRRPGNVACSDQGYGAGGSATRSHRVGQVESLKLKFVMSRVMGYSESRHG